MEYQPETPYTAEPIPEARHARRAASLCSFAAVAELVIVYAILIPTSLLTRNISMGDQMRSNLSLIINTAAVDLIAMPLCWLLLLRRLPRNGAPALGERTRLSVPKLLFYFPCAFALMFAGSLVGKRVGLLFEKGLADVIGNTLGSVDPWVTLLCAVIVGPIAEELFFRKAMMDRLSDYHPIDAILLSALLFALVHGNLTQFLYAFPLGVFFGIIYYRTRNIGYTILLHVAINTVGGLLPQILNAPVEGVPEFVPMITTLLTGLFAQFILAMSVVGVIFLIRNRREFLPIHSGHPRYKKPFFLNAGFIVACVVFVALFVLNEIIA